MASCSEGDQGHCNDKIITDSRPLSDVDGADFGSLFNGGQQIPFVEPDEDARPHCTETESHTKPQEREPDYSTDSNLSDWKFNSDLNYDDTSQDGNDSPEEGIDREQSDLFALWSLIQHRLGINFSALTGEKHEQVLDELSLDGIASYINSGKSKNIIVMTGAGISTSAGIPDFRSPGSGLYSNLEKYNLPRPESVFELDYFKENPEPFYKLAKELYPGSFKPTVSHYFINLLAKKGYLLRTYTQNIDGLERWAGLPDERIVEAHGTFHTSHCVLCKEEYSQEWVKGKIFNDEVPRCTKCEGLVKPDIVFFGESLPSKFFQMMPVDFKQCDLLIVMGTSLVVHPFASLIDRVPVETPRLLINKQKCGVGLFASLGGFDFDGENRYRDVAWLGTCDDGCLELADKLSWKDELMTMAGMEKSSEGATYAVGTSGDPKDDPKIACSTEDAPNEKSAKYCSL